MLPFGIVNVHHRGKDEMNGNMNLALGLNSDISSSSFGCEICVEEAPRIHINPLLSLKLRSLIQLSRRFKYLELVKVIYINLSG